MRKVLAALVVLTLAVAVAPAFGDDGGRPLTTALTGAAEAPVPGDPNASGTASLTLNPGLGEVCFDISWADVDGEVFASHIHVAPAGSPGPIVVTLFTGSFAGTGSQSGCVEADRDLVLAITQNPEAYYVNVHSRPNFPGGAIRGQLSK
jgi:CHRD domain